MLFDILPTQFKMCSKTVSDWGWAVVNIASEFMKKGAKRITN
jgi:hypothetical protein